MPKSGFALLAASLALAGCGRQAADGPPVSDAWVRLPAVTGRPGAAYFTLHGTGTADALTAISTAFAAKVELHESMNSGGVMTMRPLAAVEVPANGTVAFAPGGNHAMLFGIRPDVQPGGTMPLSFTFRSGRTVTVTAKTVGAGDPAPQAG